MYTIVLYIIHLYKPIKNSHIHRELDPNREEILLQMANMRARVGGNSHARPLI